MRSLVTCFFVLVASCYSALLFAIPAANQQQVNGLTLEWASGSPDVNMPGSVSLALRFNYQSHISGCTTQYMGSREQSIPLVFFRRKGTTAWSGVIMLHVNGVSTLMSGFVNCGAGRKSHVLTIQEPGIYGAMGSPEVTAGNYELILEINEYVGGRVAHTHFSNIIDYTVGIVNNPPIAKNISKRTNVNAVLPIQMDASDPDGDAISYHLVNSPPSEHGAVSLSGGSVSFIPARDWHGVTSFTYRVQDAKGAWSNTATVTITVNAPPVASPKRLRINQDERGTIALSATDVDSPPRFVFEIVTPPGDHQGKASVTAGYLNFDPRNGWHGVSSFTYRAQDTDGAWSQPANITVEVNARPVALSSELVIDEDTVGTLKITASDRDDDLLSYSFTEIPDISHGKLSVTADVVVFTPSPNWNGKTSFSYKAFDGKVYSNVATVQIIVRPVNDAPIAKTPISIKTVESRSTVLDFVVAPY